ncbi:MAG: hypothetical protein RL398_2681 [Planctomycetota bacterium]
MSKAPQMTPALMASVAEQFKALGEPSRLQLMSLLFGGERPVGELVAASGLSQANVSKQLSILHRAGWIRREKRGQSVFYSLADERTFALCELMCARVREQAACAAARLQGP